MSTPHLYNRYRRALIGFNACGMEHAVDCGRVTRAEADAAYHHWATAKRPFFPDE